MTTQSESSTVPNPVESGFDNDGRQAVTLGDSARDYLNRLRGGDMGSLPAILGLVVLFVVFSSLDDHFLTTYNMANLAVQSASIIVLAMGIVFVLLLGEIDLSAGVTGGAAATVTALLMIKHDQSWWVATLAGLGVGVVIGVAIGLLVSRLGIPSFVVTLAFYLGLQAVPLKLIGAGGSLRYNDEILRGLSIKNVSVTAGWVVAAVIVLGFAALSLWRYRSRSARGLVHKPLPLVVIQIVVLAAIVLGVTYLLSQNRAPNKQFFNISGIPWVVPVVIRAPSRDQRQPREGRRVHDLLGHGRHRRPPLGVLHREGLPRLRQRQRPALRRGRGRHRWHQPLRRSRPGDRRAHRRPGDRDDPQRAGPAQPGQLHQLRRDRWGPAPRRERGRGVASPALGRGGLAP
jgi:hypothetical protein